MLFNENGVWLNLGGDTFSWTILKNIEEKYDYMQGALAA